MNDEAKERFTGELDDFRDRITRLEQRVELLSGVLDRFLRILVSGARAEVLAMTVSSPPPATRDAGPTLEVLLQAGAEFRPMPHDAAGSIGDPRGGIGQERGDSGRSLQDPGQRGFKEAPHRLGADPAHPISDSNNRRSEPASPPGLGPADTNERANLIALVFEQWVMKTGQQTHPTSLQEQLTTRGLASEVTAAGNYWCVRIQGAPAGHCFVVPNPKQIVSPSFPNLNYFFSVDKSLPALSPRPWTVKRAAYWREQGADPPTPGMVDVGFLLLKS